jgi:hypothetical protein
MLDYIITFPFVFIIGYSSYIMITSMQGPSQNKTKTNLLKEEIIKLKEENKQLLAKLSNKEYR